MFTTEPACHQESEGVNRHLYLLLRKNAHTEANLVSVFKVGSGLQEQYLHLLSKNVLFK